MVKEKLIRLNEVVNKIKNLKPIIYLLNINKHKIEITNNYDPKIQNTGIILLTINKNYK